MRLVLLLILAGCSSVSPVLQESQKNCNSIAQCKRYICQLLDQVGFLIQKTKKEVREENNVMIPSVNLHLRKEASAKINNYQAYFRKVQDCLSDLEAAVNNSKTIIDGYFNQAEKILNQIAHESK